MRRIIILSWLFGVLVVVGPDLRGADSNPPENPPRFLFIVEKSEATRGLGLDLPQTMFDLVYRGANGHLPFGGVFEIWIFGEETIFRGFNPVMLTPNNRLALASRASGYVRATASGGVADVAKLVEHVRGAAELGMELTIIFVTAPDTRLSGTPRDVEINGVMEVNAEVQRAAARPFITAIQVQDGVLAAAAVNDSPFTMVVPPMPPAQLTAEEREGRLNAARQARLEREKPVAPPEPVVAPPVVSRPRRDIPDEEREGAIILKGRPKNTEPPPPPAAAPAVAPAVSQPEPVAPAVSTTAAPAAGVVESKPPVVSVPPPTVSTPAVPAGTPLPSDATPLPVATPTDGLTNLVPHTAVVVPTRTWLTAGGLFMAGLCFFVVAALLAWVLLRRARAAAGPSYITRSIEHRRD